MPKGFDFRRCLDLCFPRTEDTSTCACSRRRCCGEFVSLPRFLPSHSTQLSCYTTAWLCVGRSRFGLTARDERSSCVPSPIPRNSFFSFTALAIYSGLFMYSIACSMEAPIASTEASMAASVPSMEAFFPTSAFHFHAFHGSFNNLPHDRQARKSAVPYYHLRFGGRRFAPRILCRTTYLLCLLREICRVLVVATRIPHQRWKSQNFRVVPSVRNGCVSTAKCCGCGL